jgi:hypothetical protein
LTVRYRDWWGNVGMAIAAVLVAGVFGVVMWTSNGEQGPVITWIALPGAVVFLGLLAVRCFQRSVIVDDDGVTKREPWGSTFVPWRAIRDVTFVNDNDVILQLDDGRRISVHAPPTRGTSSLRWAYSDVRARWSSSMGRGTTYPRPHWRFLTIGFAASAFALVAGGGVWGDAEHDADVYAARDAREREGTAVVAHVRVDERDSGEDGTRYTTHVEARLQIPEGRTLLVDLQRNGDLHDEYDEEDAVAIVYDGAHPRDADFADRPNRAADDDSVALRRDLGPVLFWAGVVGVLGFGVGILIVWNRRGGSPDGSSVGH